MGRSQPADMVLAEEWPAWTSLDEETQENLRNHAAEIKKYLNRARIAEKDARDYLTELNLSQDELLGLWTLLESYETAALKRRNH